MMRVQKQVDFSGQVSLGKCLKCDGQVFEHGISYTCENAVGTNRKCDFRTGKIILKRPIEREQVTKLLHRQEKRTCLLNLYPRKEDLFQLIW